MSLLQKLSGAFELYTPLVLSMPFELPTIFALSVRISNYLGIWNYLMNFSTIYFTLDLSCSYWNYIGSIWNYTAKSGTMLSQWPTQGFGNKNKQQHKSFFLFKSVSLTSVPPWHLLLHSPAPATIAIAIVPAALAPRPHLINLCPSFNFTGQELIAGLAPSPSWCIPVPNPTSLLMQVMIPSNPSPNPSP